MVLFFCFHVAYQFIFCERGIPCSLRFSRSSSQSQAVIHFPTISLSVVTAVFPRSVAGSSSLNQTLPPEENSANRLVEQIQELIEFLANRWEMFLAEASSLHLSKDFLQSSMQVLWSIHVTHSTSTEKRALLTLTLLILLSVAVIVNLCGPLKRSHLDHTKSKALNNWSCLLHQWCKFSKRPTQAAKYRKRWPRWHFTGPHRAPQGTMLAGPSKCSEPWRSLSPGPCCLMSSPGS